MPLEQNSDFTDNELVEAIVKSDHAAFKKLYYRYYKALIRFAWFRTHSMDLSSELIQELFYRVWNNRLRLDSSKSIKAYLYKSLTNLIINHVNLSSSQASSIENMEDEKDISIHNDLDFGLDLNSALDKLPEKLKTVFMLSRMDGYKYSEIAEICNISVKAVEKRMSQAFSRLKKTFKKNY
jgi:RNA polymerase sigma-70 factor (ECF subfamily)